MATATTTTTTTTRPTAEVEAPSSAGGSALTRAREQLKSQEARLARAQTALGKKKAKLGAREEEVAAREAVLSDAAREAAQLQQELARHVVATAQAERLTLGLEVLSLEEALGAAERRHDGAIAARDTRDWEAQRVAAAQEAAALRSVARALGGDLRREEQLAVAMGAAARADGASLAEERDESGRLRGEVERLKAEVKSMIEIQAGSQGVAVQQAQLPLREALAQSEAALAEQQKMYGDRVDELERLVEQSGERAREEEAKARRAVEAAEAAKRRGGGGEGGGGGGARRGRRGDRRD